MAEKEDGVLVKCGEGMTSEVFLLDNNRVLKVFKPNYYENAAVEYKKTLLAGKLGVPLAKVYALTNTENGNPAIEMEYIPGTPLNKYIKYHPLKLPGIIKKMAIIAAKLSQIPCSEYLHPDIEESFVVDHLDNKRYVTSRISLIEQLNNVSDAEVNKMKRFYESIPEDRTFVHGDYNLTNIIISDINGDFRLIDFGGSGFGSWLFDLLGMYSAYYDPITIKGRNLRKVIKHGFFRFYLWVFLRKINKSKVISKITVIRTLGAMLSINRLIKCVTFHPSKNLVLARQYADEALACIDSLQNGIFSEK